MALYDFHSWLAYEVAGNSIGRYVVAFAVFLVALIVLRIFRAVVLTRITAFAKRTKTKLDDLALDFVNSIGWLFYLVVALAAAIQFLQLPKQVNQALFSLVFIVGVYYVVRAVQVLLGYWFKNILTRREKEDERFDPSAVNTLHRVSNAIVWITAILLVLQNTGFNVSTLIAGLGIGGVAFAFAVQNILGDVFASFSIYFDKPFQTGDFIIVGDDMGVVKKIGIKSTRIQTLQGEELIMSNRQLTDERVHNYKKMLRRRVVMGFGVTYETPVAKLKKIPGMVKKIIDAMENVDLDRAHFKSFGDFSLNFEVVYYVNTGDYNTYMDTQQTINLALMERFAKAGIDMAYPTQTLYLKSQAKT